MVADYEIVTPDPAGTIASLSSLGYSVEAAIADLIDNSVAARARSVEVVCTWEGAESWIAVADDGSGMTSSELLTAMTLAIKGPDTVRSAQDLGRFGMGLKTASFSQARQLTVTTKVVDGDWVTRTWDLATVRESGEWRLLYGSDPATEVVLDRLRDRRSKGTIVLWRRLHRFDSDEVTVLDQVSQRQFYGETDRIESHLGMVFARLMTGQRRLALSVNGTPVSAWDPFLSRHPSGQRLPAEELPVAGHLVRVEAFVLPHPKRLDESALKEAGGPGGWLDQQGFYVYRRNRLILPGSWLNLPGLRRQEKHNLVRISVDVPAELDAEWSVDVRKSAVVPPIAVRGHLRRIGVAACRLAEETLRHRGRVTARTRGADFVYAWNVSRDNGQLTCRINRDHPLVRQVLRGGADSSADARALVRLLEETVPVAALRVMHQSDTIDDPEPFAEAAADEVVEVARRIYGALVSQDKTPGEARRRIRQMWPFEHLDGFWNE
ncbi:ATP-binding protein [Saccharothrix sp. S26]|uniref:ATP-binding protein n=1 Tax=Saccharothrix sp. S26 TaxID=2907215 RepID=UPI001F421E57|nr:ATP-binding protein [Saccharothrix sp. S26]MCE6999973.1 ATP-binding protein [Saccharothrix sp. S26]